MNRNKYKRKNLSKHRLYHSWFQMKQRCDKPHNPFYNRYGGRGISYDPRWSSFEKFLDDMESSWKPNTSLDREDNDGNYCKENCRWADPVTQSNNRRNRREFEHNGNSMTLTEWSGEVGISRSTLSQRYYGMGWSVEKTLTTPLKH